MPWRKVRREHLGCFFHCTLECLHPHVPATSFRLMALQSKVNFQCCNERNIPPLLIQKHNKKWQYSFFSCQVRLILFNTNLITKTIFIRENHSKDAWNHRKLCETAIRTQKNILGSLSLIFLRWNSF